MRSMHPSLSVFDKPLSKREYDAHVKNCGTFLTNLAESIRSMLDMVATFSVSDIEKMTIDALTNADPISRGKSAFTVVCWHKMLAPLDNKKRKFYINLPRIEKIVEDDPESLYMYAIMVLKQPCDEVYRKLRAKNVEYANAYLTHHKQFSTAEAQYGNVNWLFNW